MDVGLSLRGPTPTWDVMRKWKIKSSLFLPFERCLGGCLGHLFSEWPRGCENSVERRAVDSPLSESSSQSNVIPDFYFPLLRTNHINNHIRLLPYLWWLINIWLTGYFQMLKLNFSCDFSSWAKLYKRARPINQYHACLPTFLSVNSLKLHSQPLKPDPKVV